ncbi:Hypothetical protein ORPV_670 [Orpheovirus IHUMI-LCC2]|uniref:Uncharacterized protein n=1 Tax=Orpheovirus IHUMI-LCC2 TaxID=2023057 RepID=A0A2I2L4W7_9VIRU|nr:Hypothetical protein ORPV_670 [Orpheovirus IHUMI-LCC2]SNW62574.1 Hypothetical protein ORPV_670 [Orpheovirus IHUMI-LCC2]
MEIIGKYIDDDALNYIREISKKGSSALIVLVGSKGGKTTMLNTLISSYPKFFNRIDYLDIHKECKNLYTFFQSNRTCSVVDAEKLQTLLCPVSILDMTGLMDELPLIISGLKLMLRHSDLKNKQRVIVIDSDIPNNSNALQQIDADIIRMKYKFVDRNPIRPNERCAIRNII